MNYLELLVGQMPEAIYFALFLIVAKKIKEKRFILIALMAIEYFLLTRVLIYNIYFQISYCFMTYIILNILYKEKSQITDIFLFVLASIILIVCSMIGYLISLFTIKSLVLASVVKDILMFLYLLLRKDKLPSRYNRYYSNWNRKAGQKVRSLTVRNISIIVFNTMFYIINLIFIYRIYIERLGMR